MASATSVIDLTAESPPTQSIGLRRSSSDAGHRLRRRPSVDALLNAEDNRHAGPSRGPETRQGRPPHDATGRHPRREARLQSTNAGGDGDDDDDVFFVGMTEAIADPEEQGGNAWERAFLGLAEGSDGDRATEVPPNLNIHEGVPRGPHGRNVRARPGPEPPYNHSINALHSHLAYPPLARNPFQVRHMPHEAWTRTPWMLADYLGALMRGPGPGPGRPAAPTAVKLPEEFDAAWTHLIPSKAGSGFTDDFIEPPIDLDTYFDDKAVVTGPLPDTTPICAGCRHALVLGGAGYKRIWILPCGHALDGRCVSRLSGLPDKVAPTTTAAAPAAAASRRKEKGKVIDPSDKASAIGPIRNTRSRTTAALHQPPVPTSNSRPMKAKKFRCPVEGCGQACHMESGHKTSCIEAFM